MRVHAFASSKGGVGKTTLAYAAARLLAADGRRVVVVDLDLHGSSFADAVDLVAPFEGGWVPGAEVRVARRHGLAPLSSVGWVQDALAAASDEAVAPRLWRISETDPGSAPISVLPTSSVPRDRDSTVHWTDADRLGSLSVRIARLLHQLLDEGVDDVVLDLPPPIAGVSEAVISLFHNARVLPPSYPSWSPSIETRVLLVGTPDRQDLVSVVEAHLALRGHQIPHVLIINRVRDTDLDGRVQEAVVTWLGESEAQASLVIQEVRPVAYDDRTLARLFQGTRATIDDLAPLRSVLLGAA
jgi:Mrp family chromosome partitioning ATPase